MLWVTIRMLLEGKDPAFQRSSISPGGFSAVSTSKALNGSSMRSASGSSTKARAKPTRCFMPPESSFG